MNMKVELKFGCDDFRYGNRPLATVGHVTRAFQENALNLAMHNVIKMERAFTDTCQLT